VTARQPALSHSVTPVARQPAHTLIRVCRCHTGTFGHNLLPAPTVRIAPDDIPSVSPERGGRREARDLGCQGFHPGYQDCCHLWHGRHVPIANPDLAATPHPRLSTRLPRHDPAMALCVFVLVGIIKAMVFVSQAWTPTRWGKAYRDSMRDSATGPPS